MILQTGIWENPPSYSEEHLTAEAKIQSQGSPCGICGGQNFTKTSSSSTSFAALNYNSTKAPYS